MRIKVIILGLACFMGGAQLTQANPITKCGQWISSLPKFHEIRQTRTYRLGLLATLGALTWGGQVLHLEIPITSGGPILPNSEVQFLSPEDLKELGAYEIQIRTESGEVLKLTVDEFFSAQKEQPALLFKFSYADPN